MFKKGKYSGKAAQYETPSSAQTSFQFAPDIRHLSQDRDICLLHRVISQIA